MDPRRKEKKRNRRKRRLLKRKSARQGFPDHSAVLVAPPGRARMSEVLMEFLEPYSDRWQTEEELEKLVCLAEVAWNAALFSGSERNNLLQNVLQTVPPELRQDLRSLVEEMIQRKEAHFADNQRMIISHKLTATASGPHLTVLSTLDRA